MAAILGAINLITMAAEISAWIVAGVALFLVWFAISLARHLLRAFFGDGGK